MGIRGIVGLLVVALGLFAVLWFTDEKTKIEKVAETRVLEGRSLNDCVRMRWQFRGRPPIEIGRADDQRFQLQEPIVDIASAAHMRQIMAAWDSAMMRATPLNDDVDGRRQAGLLEPEFTFLVEFPDKTSISIDVGAPGPLGTTRFLRSHGKIWEGGDGLIESMRGNPDDLREKVVFRNAFGQVTEVLVDQERGGGKRETLHLRLEKGGWVLVAPVQGRADPAAAQNFVTAVVGLRVDDFPRGAPRLPDRAPSIEVMVKGSFGEERLKLWDENREMFGNLPGRNLLFTSSSLQYAQIFENAAERLRARILVPLQDTAFAELIDLIADPGQGHGDRVHLSRESPSHEWRLVEPVTFAAAVTPTQAAVEAVQTLVAMEFAAEPHSKHPRADDPRYGLQPGAGRFTLTTRGIRDTATTTLWFGSEVQRGDEHFVYASRADEPDTVVLVQKPQVDRLKRAWVEYCDLRVLRITGCDRLELKRGEQTRAFQVEGGKWRKVGDPAERPELENLVIDVLGDLVGKKAVDARGPAFDKPDWTLWLMRKGGDRLMQLRFWDAKDQPLVVATGDEKGPVAFELSALDSRNLRELWQ